MRLVVLCDISDPRTTCRGRSSVTSPAASSPGAMLRLAQEEARSPINQFTQHYHFEGALMALRCTTLPSNSRRNTSTNCPPEVLPTPCLRRNVSRGSPPKRSSRGWKSKRSRTTWGLLDLIANKRVSRRGVFRFRFRDSCRLEPCLDGEVAPEIVQSAGGFDEGVLKADLYR